MSSTRRSAFAYSDRDHCLTVYGDAVLSFSLQPPNPRYLQAWAAALERRIAVSSAPIAVLTVIDGHARTPDETAKLAIRQAVSRHQRHIYALAYVIEGQGFVAAAMRSALSLISLTARYPFPQKVFANTVAATAWTVQQTPPGSGMETSAAGMISAIEAMRSELARLAATG